MLFGMEGRGVLQVLIPYLWQLELAYVTIKGWIIDPDVHSLLDGHGDVLCLPTHYGEIDHTDGMTRGVTMVIDRRGGPEIFLKPYPKSPWQFTYVLL